MTKIFHKLKKESLAVLPPTIFFLAALHIAAFIQVLMLKHQRMGGAAAPPESPLPFTSGPTWPSYPGPDPIGDMQRDGLSHLVLTMHRVNEKIDDGEFFARSHPVAIPPGINAIEMHRITWPQMGGFIRNVVVEILHADEVSQDQPDSMTMHEEMVPYFAG